MVANLSITSNVVTTQSTTSTNIPLTPSPNASMLQLFLEYLKNTSVFHLTIHLLYIIMICIFLSLSYIAAFHWSSIVEIYETANSHQHFDENLKLNVVTDNKILSLLQEVMESTGGMRAYVYRYHNGLPAISGIPFFFQTNTHEVIAPGASRILLFEQRIPTSIHTAQNIKFTENKCLFVSNTQQDTINQNYEFFERRGAVAVLRCPIFLTNGDLFGFVGLDWNHVVAEDPKVEEQLSTIAKTLSNTFTMIKN
jgi:hypothetical protein